MSMLAEPRRKQKVINLRAKNNAWSNDTAKFGQRMLEKMGWSSGKGLGAKENGIVEHVVARYKNDEKGLGFEDRNDQWTKHEDDFNSLLSKLSNADNSTDTLHSGISLEKKSKTSKARIHYHKFTRGKDLSRYSDKDLANIFGKKSFKEHNSKECVKQDILTTTDQVFTEKGNMNDYFKSKLAAIKSKQLTTPAKADEKSDYTFQGFSSTTEQESKQDGSGFQPFSFYNTEKEKVSQPVEIICQDKTKSNKKRKSKQKELCSEEMMQNKYSKTLPESNEETFKNVELNNIKVKKSKKKKHIECFQETPILDMVDESNTPKGVQDIIMDEGSTELKKSKKKKYKECIKQIESSVKVDESNYSECTQQAIIDVESKKTSKKKKHQKNFEDLIQPFESIIKAEKNKKRSHFEEKEQMSTEENVPKKKKKRKNQECR